MPTNEKRRTDMTKPDARDLDNMSRLLIKLPADEAAKVLKEVKREQDPEGKRKIIDAEEEGVEAALILGEVAIAV